MRSPGARSLQEIISRLLISRQITFALVVGVIILVSSYRSGQVQIAERQRAAFIFAQMIGNYYDSASRALRALAAMPPSQDSLDAVQKTYVFFDILYRIDRSGRLSGVSRPDRWLPLGMDMSAQPYFNPTLKDIAISDAFISPHTGNLTVYLIMPVVEDGGLIVGELNLSNLEESITHANLAESGVYFIIEQDGDLLAHPDKTLVQQQSNLRQLGIDRQFLNQSGGYMLFREGNLVIENAATIPQTGWLVILETPLSDIYGAFLNPAIFGLILTLGFFLWIMNRERKEIGTRVITPLSAISQEAQRLASGDYTQAMSSPARTAYLEVDSLANSFELMKQAVISREMALRASEERFRLAMEASSDGIWDWDVVKDTVYYSPAYCQMLGYTSEEFPGQTQSWEGSIHPEDAERAIRANFDCVENKAQSFEIEYRVRMKNGDWKWILGRGKAVARDASGRATRMIGTHVDMTERKKAEEEIRQLNADLERRVLERTTQLEASNQELEAFAYSVSHDLRAPLRGIDGWSFALLEDYSSQLDATARQYLDRIRGETQRMGRLIDDLLRLSLVTRNKMHWETVQLSELVCEITRRLQESQPERRFEIRIQPDLTARGDGHLLEIALTNLLGNAAKFSGPRPLTQIEFGQVQMDGHPVYFVRDHGVGFDLKLAQKLFGAFQRMHRASEFPGSGIGLATVQRIIHRHGGTIWAESEVNRGATFYFTLEGSG